MNTNEREYQTAVNNLATEALAHALDHGEDTDSYEHVHELIHSSPWIINTNQNKKVLVYTDNENAYLDAYGLEPADFKHGIPWAKFAYCAMVADVHEKIDLLFQMNEETK
jgi:hypothetical protein